MRTYVIVQYPSGLEKQYKAKMISAEEVEIKIDGKKHTFYTGIYPKIRESNFMGWLGRKQVFYNRFGYPFCHDHLTGKIISDEKKREILVDQKVCFPVDVGREKTIYVAMYREGDHAGEPVFKDNIPDDLLKELKGKKGKEKLRAFQHWIDDNIEEVSQLEIYELPVKTEHDVTEIEMIRGEWSQIIHGNALKEYARIQDQIGDKDQKPWVMLLISSVTIVLVVLFFLWFANEGAFG